MNFASTTTPAAQTDTSISTSITMGRSTDLDRDTADENPYGGAGAGAGASSLIDEAALFASPLPMVGVQKTTTRKELWVSSDSNAYHTPG